MIAKVISGGQFGVDQGALYAARDVGIPTGGWAPGGWRTERGTQRALLQSFGLIAHPQKGYPPRTEENVIGSDCTLIISRDPAHGGSGLTMKLCEKHGRPV